MRDRVEKRGKQNKKGSSRWWMLWFGVAFVLIGVGLYRILPPYLDRAESAKAYEKLAESYVSDASEATEEEREKKKDWWLTEVTVEFEKLKEENPDIVAWIRFDDTKELGIDYPVLYSGDNETYLRKDLYGKTHIAGSIFLEGLNQADFSDYYNILYGHNMRDGSMFGSLKKYKDKGFWEKHQYFTLYTETTAYRYRIFSYENATNGGEVYKVGYQPGKEYQDFIDHMVKNSAIDTGVTPQSSNKILTLSTCTGQGYEKRFAVHAVCVDAQSVDVK